MTTQVIGQVEVSATPDASGNLVYTAKVPSGKIYPISPNTVLNITNPEYVAQKQASVLKSISDPADAQAIISFYNEAPSQFPSFVDSAQAEADAAPNTTVGATDSTNTEQQNEQYSQSGGSDDDSGSSGEENPPITDDELQAWAKTPDYVKLPTNSGTTVAGKADNNAKKTSNPAPGKRLQNPLGNFSSYTYQITLYMITPDAYQAFVDSGRTNINAINNTSATAAAALASAGKSGNGAFIVAQSGGIGKNGKRAPGFDLDYYIDDLKITSAINGKATQTATNTTGISFSIYEPYGFSLITKLKYASMELAKVAKSEKFKDLTNPSKQFFVLGIRFQGYDKNGKVLTGQETFAQDTFNPTGNNDGVYERFYDITISSLKFKIDGKATTYNITAATTAPGAAFGVKRGIIDKGAKLQGTTVRDMLIGNDPKNGVIGLFTKLTDDAKTLVGTGYTAGLEPTYTVKFLGDAEQLIGDALVVNKADLDWSRSPNAPTKNVKDSNPAFEEAAVPNSNMKQLTFRNGTPTLQAIQLIISQSEFLTKALTKIYTTENEPDPKTNSDDAIVNNNPATLRWYNICPELKVKGWDPKTNDYAYDITYIIQTYETPIVTSAFAKKTSKYYGPHKRYQYWYTGKNSEILSYEQTMDNTYFNVTVAGADNNNPSAGTGGGAQISTKPGGQNNAPDQGAKNVGYEAQGNFITSLFDPGAYASAKISILGDPDFLMSDSVSSEQTLYNQYYGTDGYTINPNGGQVFIEIDFKEAQDYQNSTGTLRINDSILFWKYPPEIAKIVQGVSYQVITVTSSFKGGKFTQELQLVINTFSGTDGTSQTQDNSGGREPVQSTQASVRAIDNQIAAGTSAPTSTGKNTSSNKGELPYDEFAGLDQAVEQQKAINEAEAADSMMNGASNNQITSPTGGTDTTAPTIAQIVANSPVIQSSQSVPINKAVQDEDATSSNATTRAVQTDGRE